jgi:hypothetical protein
MEKFVFVNKIAFITIITMNVIFLITGDALLTYHTMKIAFSLYSIYTFVAEAAMEFILFILTKNVACITIVS